MPGHIPWKKVDLKLQSARTIWLSSTQVNGNPHTVPLWYLWDNHRCYIATTSHSKKARNLKNNPNIVLHLGNGDDAIILEGAAHLIEKESDLQQIDAAYQEKYVDPHSGAKAPLSYSGDNVYCITPSRIMAWEYGVVATRTDWHF